MANPLGVWETATGAVVAIGVGEAIQDAVNPEFEVVKQTAWRNYPSKVLDPQTAALSDSQRLVSKVETADDAARNGIGAARYALLQQLALSGPGAAQALQLWRRGDIDEADFEHALDKSSLEPRWLAPMLALFTDRLDPASIANGIQQGYLPNPGVLPTSPSTEPGRVPTVGAQNIDPLAEAQAQGFDLPRLRVLAGLAGLPPGPFELLTMLRRGVIDVSDVSRGIAQGHTKTEWLDAYLALVDNILSPEKAAELRLKGWIGAQQSYDIGALSGLNPGDMDLLYQAGGRPPAPGQMATAVARGFATQDDFQRAIVESDIRPEWGQVLYDIRNTYPSLFFTKAAVAAGEVDDQTATDWLIWEKYTPDVAAKLVASFHKAKAAGIKELTRADVLTFYAARYIDQPTATADLLNLGYNQPEVDLLLEHADAQRVLRFLNSAVGKVHTLYVDRKITRPQAVDAIGQLGIPASARDDMLGLWDDERAVNIPTLSPGGITTLLHDGLITSEAAYQSLVDRGYPDLAARAEVSRYAPFGADGALPAQLTTPI